VENNPRPARWTDLGSEPFRIFFPLGTAAGIAGVALWPLHLLGGIGAYPGAAHLRLMANGFFGAFIIGFLGTALPRMLSTTPLGLGNTLALALLHALMAVSYAAGYLLAGDILWLALLLLFAGLVLPKLQQRKDLPPPGFVLAALAWLCAGAGAALALALHFREPRPFEPLLQKLLSTQGLVLLPILGVGPFLLPRFFGRQSAHDLPASRQPSLPWRRKAAAALVTGSVVIASFFLEAAGWVRAAHALRFGAVLAYLAAEFPFLLAAKISQPFPAMLRIAFLLIAAALAAVALLPQFRVGWLHAAFMGGFSVITLLVAVRVLFGHASQRARLQSRTAWLWWASGLIWLGMITRVSGDLWPKIMFSHYNYGAILWCAGVGLWAWKVLPCAWRAED